MTSEIETTEKTDNLDLLTECMYSHMNQLLEHWRNRVYFTDTGKARLSSIAGYVVGLNHAGEKELAQRMADDFILRVEQLSLKGNDFEYAVGEVKDDVETRQTVKVPSRKCVVSDDGTLHGFRLMWYGVLRPEVYYKCLTKHRKEIERERDAGKEVYENPHNRAVKELNIIEKLDPNVEYGDTLTERRYVGGATHEFFYVPGFNGGLLYHGPGGGEVFSVHLGGNDTLWAIHT